MVTGTENREVLKSVEFISFGYKVGNKASVPAPPEPNFTPKLLARVSRELDVLLLDISGLNNTVHL